MTEEKKEHLVNYVRKIVSKKRKDLRKLEQNLPVGIEEFENAMMNDFHTAKFDTMSRWKIAKKILEEVNLDQEYREIFLEFASERHKEVSPLNAIRNLYAHKTRAELENEHTEEMCIEIRRKITKQQDNLENILEVLGEA